MEERVEEIQKCDVCHCCASVNIYYIYMNYATNDSEIIMISREYDW